MLRVRYSAFMARQRGIEMLTVREAAQRLGVSQSSIRVWLDREPGRFRGAEKFGFMWMIPVSALDGFKLRLPGRPSKPKEKAAPAKKKASKGK